MAAEELQIGPSGGIAKLRGPAVVGILSVVTLGIYFFVWYYRINRELRDFGRARSVNLGDSPGTSLLAVTLGALVVVPAVVSLYRTGKRIQEAQQLAGVQPLNGWLAIVLYLVFSPLLFAYEQSELNKVWETQRQLGSGMGDAPMPAAR